MYLRLPYEVVTSFGKLKGKVPCLNDLLVNLTFACAIMKCCFAHAIFQGPKKVKKRVRVLSLHDLGEINKELVLAEPN